MWFGVAFQLWADDSERSSVPAPVEVTSRQSAVPPLLRKVEDTRERLDKRGIAGNLTFVNDWSKNFRGGASSAGSFDRYSLDLSLTLDTRKLANWSGGTAFVRMKNHFGANGGDYVGDAQGFSNIDDVPRTRLYELWYEQKFFSDRLRLKAGKIDANSDFAVVQVAGDFLNSSMGYSPTIVALPTYPEPQPAVTLFVIPRSHYQVSTGFFRTLDDGNMLLLEGSRAWRIGVQELNGRFSLGAWHLTGKIPCFDGDDKDGTEGIYLVGEQTIFSRKFSNGEQRLSAFMQFGHADGDISRFTRHLGGGLVLSPLFSFRPQDSIGAAVTSARFTDSPDAGYEYPSELASEVYYKIGLTHFISVVPDVQFIHHPGGIRAQEDACVFTPRLVLSF